MSEDIQKLEDKIAGRNSPTTLIGAWDILMKEYGWIPRDEFWSLDAQDVTDLLDIIDERNKKSSKSLPKGRRGV